MLYEDLSALYAQFVDSDDVPVDEVMSAIRTYSEENDLLFTEVLSDLHEERMAAIKVVAKWTTYYHQSLLQSWLFSTSICEVIMNILPSFCKLNRFFRHQMEHYFQEFPFDGYMTIDDLDDIDNMYAGCAFE